MRFNQVVPNQILLRSNTYYFCVVFSETVASLGEWGRTTPGDTIQGGDTRMK